MASPSDPELRFTREFDFKKDQDPILAGERKTYLMACCSLTMDPFNNRIFKRLPEDALIEVRLLSVMDHKNALLLDIDGYEMRDHLRLGVVQSCLAEIQAAGEAWVPKELHGGRTCAGSAETENLFDLSAEDTPELAAHQGGG